MRKILRYILEFQRKHFDTKLYVFCALFLAVCFVFNYTLDFEDEFIDAHRYTIWHSVHMFWWMSVPFLGIVLILYLTKKDEIKLNTKDFWVPYVVGFAILSLERGFIGFRFLKDIMHAYDYYFVTKCLYWSSSLLTTVLPLILVYIIFHHERPRNFYGLAAKKFDPKPYFILLCIALVFIGIGSFFSDIQNYYPRFQRSGGERFAEHNDIASWVTVLIYELAYGSDFIAVEVFFRGFMIHAFVKTLGGYAVLPMVATYAFLHFGKPLTEAISSVFGGYILGIISYYSRSVWGGIIIHIGIAWGMELFGYLQGL